MPILELDDGWNIIEGLAVVQYIAVSRPEAGLAPPAGTMARMWLQSRLDFVTSEPHKPTAMMSSPKHAPVGEALPGHFTKRLESVFGKVSSPFHLGESFSVADPYLFVVLDAEVED